MSGGREHTAKKSRKKAPMIAAVAVAATLATTAGAISDGKELFIMYNVIFDEDPWSIKNGWLNYNEWLYLDVGYPYGGESGGRLNEGFVSKREGKTVYTGYLDVCGIDDVKMVRVSFNYLQGAHYSPNKRRCNINEAITVRITDEVKRFNKTVDIPDAPCVELGSAGNWDLIQLEATPLGVCFSLETDGEVTDTGNFFFYLKYVPVYVNFKDGTSLDIMSGYRTWNVDEDNKTLWLEWLFNYPVDVDEIESIQFVNALVDMKDGCVTAAEAPNVPVGHWEGSEGVTTE